MTPLSKKIKINIKFTGITFIRYAQSQKVGKQDNLLVLGARKQKDLNRKVNIGQGHLRMKEENLIFNINYIIYM